MDERDRWLELIKRNRALVARAAQVRSHTGESVITAEHLAGIFRQNRERYGGGEPGPVIVSALNRRTTR